MIDMISAFQPSEDPDTSRRPHS